jgi:DNA-binding response OmpR family regulator
MRVLLVEDSPRLQASVARGLRKSGYAVDVCGDGLSALALATGTEYDAIVLDLLLPKMDGWSVLKRLRERGNASHVLILSAKDRVEDRVQGLRLGADDYLVKPFSFDELVARIDALTRRAKARKNPEIVIGSIAIDTVRKTVTKDGTPVEMTAREYRLLEYLAFHRGQPVSRGEIEDHIYAADRQVLSNAVDSAICALRAKLDDGGAGSVIRTRRGLGYCLDDPVLEEGRSG